MSESIRHSVEVGNPLPPHVYRRSGAIAHLAIDKLRGKQLTREYAAREIEFCNASGITPDQAINQAEKYSQGVCGETVQLILNSEIAFMAEVFVAALAEFDSTHSYKDGPGDARHLCPPGGPSAVIAHLILRRLAIGFAGYGAARKAIRQYNAPDLTPSAAIQLSYQFSKGIVGEIVRHIPDSADRIVAVSMVAALLEYGQDSIDRFTSFYLIFFPNPKDAPEFLWSGLIPTAILVPAGFILAKYSHPTIGLILLYLGLLAALVCPIYLHFHIHRRLDQRPR